MMFKWTRLRSITEAPAISLFYASFIAVLTALFAGRASCAAIQSSILAGFSYDKAILATLLLIGSALAWLIMSLAIRVGMPENLRDHRSKEEYLEKEEKISSDKAAWPSICTDLIIDWDRSNSLKVPGMALMGLALLVWFGLLIGGVLLFFASLPQFLPN